MDQRLTFSIEAGDILSFKADVVGLKYAQDFYGADEKTAQALVGKGIPLAALRPKVGDHVFIDSLGAIGAHQVLFVGVKSLGDFNYQQIRAFAAKALSILAKEAPYIRNLAMTVHGPGYGLDESESLRAQLAGYLDAQRKGQIPQGLQHIWIIERNQARVERLRQVLSENLGQYATSYSEPQTTMPTLTSSPAVSPLITEKVPTGLDQAGSPTLVKPHAFVAMPFSQEWDDTYFFGIQQPVHRLDLLCERTDQYAFTGDILQQIKTKIESARVVVAEVTDKNPNVFLEVGYAWGKGRPTVLLVRDQTELPFDIQGTRCLRYGSIQHLEQALTKELTELHDAGII